MQASIKVPTGGFQVSNLTNLVGGAGFALSSRYDHPTEAPTFDYLSFTLQNLGTTAISYQNGVEVPLFTFENTGACTGGSLFLVNDTDPFLPPNSLSANVGQQLTTLGYGTNDVPICIAGSGTVACATACRVEYEIISLGSGKYQVSMIPRVTWNSPDNMTSTMQVSLRAPTGGLELANFTSLVAGAAFRTDEPIRPPDGKSGVRLPRF